MKKAKIAEIFFSIQGEGPYTGTSQLFIRFVACNINCRYCDTKRDKFKVYTSAGLAAKAAKLIARHRPQYLCLTGGEPLLEAGFIAEFLKKLGKKRPRV